MRLVAPAPRVGRSWGQGRPERVHLGRQHPEVGAIADHVLRLRDEGARTSRVVDREVGTGEREEAHDGPGGAAAVMNGRRLVARASSRRAPAMSPRWIDRLMRAARDGMLEKYPSTGGAGSIASLSSMRAAAASHAPRSAATRARCPRTQYRIASWLRCSGSVDPVGEGRVGAGLVAHREPRDGQLPEREVPPRAEVPLELNRPGCICQGVVRAPAGHGGPEHRPPGLEGGRAIRRPALERSTLGDVREAHRPGDIARGELLPGSQDGEPRACHERIGAEARSP